MPGKAFAVVVAIITLVIAYCVITHVWWMPVDISAHGPKIDHQIEETIFGAGILFIAGQLVLASFAFLYGDSKGARKMKAFPGGAKSLIVFACVVVGVEILVLSFVGSKAGPRSISRRPTPTRCASMCKLGSLRFTSVIPDQMASSGRFIPSLLMRGRKITLVSTQITMRTRRTIS